jgi:hypothetical protein
MNIPEDGVAAGVTPLPHRNAIVRFGLFHLDHLAPARFLAVSRCHAPDDEPI